MVALLHGEVDRFNGVTVREVPADAAAFAASLDASLRAWAAEGRSAAWLRVPVERAACVPEAISRGFEIHHAQKGYIMLTKWLLDSPSLLPKYAAHYVGIGGLVLNSKSEILCVAERFGYDKKVRFKLPGGLVDAGESLASGVEREVLEETGLRVRFQAITCFRHNLEYPGGFGNADIYFCATCTPVDEAAPIKMDSAEIAACEWVPLDKFLSDPNVYEFNKVLVELSLQRASSPGEQLELVADQLGARQLPGVSNYYRKGAALYHMGPHRDVDHFSGITGQAPENSAYYWRALRAIEVFMDGKFEELPNLFSESGVLCQHVGPASGRSYSPKDIAEGLRRSRSRLGAVAYSNRRRHFGQRAVVEQHTVTYPNSPNQSMSSFRVESVMCLTLDEEGFVTRLEEYADPTPPQRYKALLAALRKRTPGASRL